MKKLKEIASTAAMVVVICALAVLAATLLADCAQGLLCKE